MHVKIMTWNIWSGRNWKDVIRFVKDNEIEVMGFQEVDNNFGERTGYIDVCKKVADSLGFHYVYCPSIEKKDGDEIRQFGNCVISKFPIMEHKRHLLNPGVAWRGDYETEPRTLLETKIKINDKVVCFMTLHLAYSKEFITTDIRLEQIETVVGAIEKSKNYPIVLLGDFNSLPGNREIKEIEKHLINTDKSDKRKTWTMHDSDVRGWKVPKGLRYKIDYVFLSGGIQYRDLEVPEVDISDHLPIILRIGV